MKKNIFLIGFLCFMMQVVACGQENAKNNNNLSKNQPIATHNPGPKDSGLVKLDFPSEVPIDYQSYRERDAKLPKTKTIGNTQLFLKDGNYVIYENRNGYTYTEIIPNVILLDKIGKGIEFYDKDGRNLINKLDYSDNPYLKKGIENLTVGFPDMEYYHFIGNNNIELVKEKTTQYFTDFRIFYSKHNFVAIAYSLIGATEENKINKYEYTVYLYDKEGKKVNEVKINHAIEQMIVSDDGRYLCFTYGGGGNGDVTSPEFSKFTIYDFQTQSYVIEISDNRTDVYVGGFEEIAPNIFSTGIFPRSINESFYGIDIFIDLEKRNQYTLSYNSNENFDKTRTVMIDSYYRFFQTQLFKVQKF